MSEQEPMIIDMSVSMMYRRIAESCMRVIVRAAGYDEERVAASVLAGRIWPTAFIPSLQAIGHWISRKAVLGLCLLACREQSCLCLCHTPEVESFYYALHKRCYAVVAEIAY